MISTSISKNLKNCLTFKKTKEVFLEVACQSESLLFPRMGSRPLCCPSADRHTAFSVWGVYSLKREGEKILSASAQLIVERTTSFI